MQEELVGVEAKESVDDEREKQGVHDELAIVREADEDVEGHPGDGEPPCPVIAEEHEDADEDGEQSDELDPDAVGMMSEELGKVVCKPENSDSDVEA